MISSYFLFRGITHPLIVLFLWIHAMKGITSLIGSIAAGYYFDWMGVTDILAAIMILFIPIPFLGHIFRGVASAIGLIMGFKGAYTIFFSLF